MSHESVLGGEWFSRLEEFDRRIAAAVAAQGCRHCGGPLYQGNYELLNRATQGWIEQEYHRRVHSEIQQTPLDRCLSSPSVVRPCPSSDALRRAFRMELRRKQRLSDGTITAFGIRYELPSAYRTLLWVSVRVARWDLSSIDLVDSRSGAHLATLLPLDREKNADRRRRALPSHDQNIPDPDNASRRAGVAPLLQKLMADYSATGLPPAYLTKDHAFDHPALRTPNHESQNFSRSTASNSTRFAPMCRLKRSTPHPLSMPFCAASSSVSPMAVTS